MKLHPLVASGMVELELAGAFIGSGDKNNSYGVSSNQEES